MRNLLLVTLLAASESCGQVVDTTDAAGQSPPTAATDMGGVGFPPGSVLIFAGVTVPTGWLMCDGKALSADDYPALFKAIGSSWGDGGDGAGPLFNLPDFRGLFLRGVDAGAKRDPEAEQRTALTQGGNTGNRVGAFQRDGTALPKFPFSYRGETLAPIGCGGLSSCTVVSSPLVPNPSGGDPETRPKNVGVHYIIKY